MPEALRSANNIGEKYLPPSLLFPDSVLRQVHEAANAVLKPHGRKSELALSNPVFKEFVILSAVNPDRAKWGIKLSAFESYVADPEAFPLKIPNPLILREGEEGKSLNVDVRYFANSLYRGEHWGSWDWNGYDVVFKMADVLKTAHLNLSGSTAAFSTNPLVPFTGEMRLADDGGMGSLIPYAEPRGAIYIVNFQKIKRDTALGFTYMRNHLSRINEVRVTGKIPIDYIENIYMHKDVADRVLAKVGDSTKKDWLKKRLITHQYKDDNSFRLGGFIELFEEFYQGPDPSARKYSAIPDGFDVARE